MREREIPLIARAATGAAIGYLATRLFYVRWHDTVYYDLRYVSREGQMFEELWYILLFPVSVALLLQLLAFKRNDIFAIAAATSAACAYVAAKQIFLTNVDKNGEWYAAHFIRGFLWLFATGMILPWFAGHISPRLSNQRNHKSNTQHAPH